MARPSRKQLACRNAVRIKMQRAKERQETGDLAEGSASQDRDTSDTGHDTATSTRIEDNLDNSKDNGEGEGGDEVAEADIGDRGTSPGASTTSGVFTAYVAPITAPTLTSVSTLAPLRPAPVGPSVAYRSGQRYNALQPPFQYFSTPHVGPSNSSSSNYFLANASSASSNNYIGHPPSNPQSHNSNSLPPLQHSSVQNSHPPPSPFSQNGQPPESVPKPASGVSNYNHISGKPVCRQTLWRRKKRAEAAALNTIPEPPEPDPVRQHREEMAEAVEKWPRVNSAKMKEDILDAAIADMEKLLKSKVRRPKGQDFNRHQQVLQFMNIQRMNRTNTPRMDLALVVANMYRKGREVADRIVRHEKEWIKRRVIPAGGQGKNAKVPSMLEDEGTLNCIKAYIEEMGEKLTAAGLAIAVSTYWQSEKAYEDNMMQDAEDNGEPPPDQEAKKRKLTLSSRTASTWLGKLGYIFEDGIYRFKGVPQIIAPPQEGGVGGYP